MSLIGDLQRGESRNRALFSEDQPHLQVYRWFKIIKLENSPIDCAQKDVVVTATFPVQWKDQLKLASNMWIYLPCYQSFL